MRSVETIELVLPSYLEFDDTTSVTDEAKRIIDIIGEDCVVALESDAAFIDFYEKLHQVENPFIQTAKNPLDLSAVDRKTAGLVNEFRGIDDQTGNEIDKKSPFAGMKDRHISKFGQAGRTVYNASHRLLTENDNNLQGFRTRIADLVPDDGSVKPSASDINRSVDASTIILAAKQFEEIADTLVKIADLLPGDETYLVLKNIFGRILDHYQAQNKPQEGSGDTYIARVIREKATEITNNMNAPLHSDARQLLKLTKELSTEGRRVINSGKETYSALNSAIARQHYKLALSTIQTARIAKNNIRVFCESNTDPNQIDVLRLSEEFLTERVNAAAEIVRLSLSPEERYRFNQVIEFEFGENVAAMTEAQKGLTEKQTDPSVFSRLVTEARDILKGGRRLVKYGNEKRVQELADQLIRLRDENRVGETRVLEIEECGLIIASIMGRFKDFTDTQAHIKMDHPDRGLHDLEKLRPKEVELIRGFNLPGAMKKLNSLINNQNIHDLLDQVLNQDEFAALKDALNQYHIEADQGTVNENQRLSEAV